jgi:glycine/D-amino acid oxidase-like deaminating enzyme
MQADSGTDVGFRRSGSLFLSRDPEELATWEKWIAIARAAGPFRHPVAVRDRRAPARQHRHLARRARHAQRRAGRAVEGGAGLRAGGAPARRHHPSRLRRARAGDRGRPRQRGEAWGGTIDSTPDTIPVISAVGKLPGFFLATGFSGHGIGLAADAVTGDTPLVDPAGYGRLVDGRRLEPAGLL